MANWRSKVLSSDDYAAFVTQYGDLWTSLGSKQDMALFSRHDPGSSEYTVLIPPLHSELVERLSGQGWADHDSPQELDWRLEMGHADAARNFGLKPG
jgi:hypothetical protein